MTQRAITVDANEAVAGVAYKVNEVIVIYPITPSSPMGEFTDQWAAEGRPNVWGSVPDVVEMQSEGGVAGAVHGALQTGGLSTTFTASQGLLLMLPNMYKIAGELTPTVFHVTARTLATHALSIFGDHSDVMAARATGFALLASGSVQEAQDLAAVSHAATLEARVPFLHFFDGFRTSHEVNKITPLTDDDLREMIDNSCVAAHRARALTPDRPVLRGTAQNPDVFFQARETCNPYYMASPEIVQNAMDRLAEITGRAYRLFDYVGAPDAERVLVMMGSGAEAAEEAVHALNKAGEKVGLLKVRLYRPFSVAHFVQALPATTKVLGVLDRTKEPGSAGEPLYVDVVTAVVEGMSSGQAPFSAAPKVIGGRYGLSSKEFTPAMAKGVLDEMNKPQPKNHFTVGIVDDVTHTSIDYDPHFTTESPETVRAIFYGLGADGTVGANKNSIKIIGEDTPNHAQGYFVYDSKKSGSVTISHLRFGPEEIGSTYLISRANFVACHQFPLLEQFDVLAAAEPEAVFLLNSPYGPNDVWDKLPEPLQKHLVEKKLKFYVIDGYSVAKEAGLGRRINTVMQTCFFAISGILPREEAIEAIKDSIKKTYGKRGEAVVQRNFAAVDTTLANLHEVKVPGKVTSETSLRAPVPPEAPEFVQQVTARMIAGAGDALPVSALPSDGTFPVGTTKWEKRNVSLEIPVWDPDICIQCGKCVLVCPHAVIRSKVYDASELADAPSTFKSAKARSGDFKGLNYSLQVAPEDCTGCTLCVQVCPVKNKKEPKLKAINMAPQPPLRDPERDNWTFFLGLPEVDRNKVHMHHVKEVQYLEPLFEFSGACAGCGETPYVKLVSQLFGDRALVANATGCSSIYGGNLPTTPWTCNADGRGPAWSNSLFEDNAEFGFGMRLTLDKQRAYAGELLKSLAGVVGDELVDALLTNCPNTEEAISEQRKRVAALREKIANVDGPAAADLRALADAFVPKSVWIMGGDGWAYDIGFGGLDHVLSSGRNVNVLVLDTEVYSNTGGQQSKSTPRAAVAKFAAKGRPARKKDMALIAMTYGNVYVARVAMGANDNHTLKTFLEAEAYDGPSLILAYSHCIAHGYDLSFGMDQQKGAVQSGHWPLMRYNPGLAHEGKNPFQLDSKAPTIPLRDYAYNETRYNMLARSNPERAELLLKHAQDDVAERWQLYEYLANMPLNGSAAEAVSAGVAAAADSNGSDGE